MVSRSEWKAKDYDYTRTELSQPNYIIICDTREQQDECHEKRICLFYVQLMQEDDHELYGDIQFNFLIGGDGNIYEGRGWDFAGSHTEGYNNVSLSIAFLGKFDDVNATQGKIEAAEKLVDYAFKHDKVSKDYKLMGQKQVKNVDSPGHNVQEIIEKWPHWVESL